MHYKKASFISPSINSPRLKMGALVHVDDKYHQLPSAFIFSIGAIDDYFVLTTQMKLIYTKT